MTIPGPWDADVVPHPWITFAMRLRYDEIDRRQEGLWAVAHWSGADASLREDAWHALLIAEWDMSDAIRDVDGAEVAYKQAKP